MLLFDGRVLVSEFSLDDLRQGDIGETHARGCLDQWPVPGAELPDPPGNDVDENLGHGDFLGGFFKELGGHDAAFENERAGIWGKEERKIGSPPVVCQMTIWQRNKFEIRNQKFEKSGASRALPAGRMSGFEFPISNFEFSQ
jgi:hypothetical protein